MRNVPLVLKLINAIPISPNNAWASPTTHIWKFFARDWHTFSAYNWYNVEMKDMINKKKQKKEKFCGEDFVCVCCFQRFSLGAFI